ncbi:ABC-2 type transport system permease protein [Alkalibacillus filiformis]|uniref:ABC-2 type transport system permease protein n=1 Tax=Alkalibacillus filiformis TaxID=200990 RepID=A0ABU0DUW0_9BACI|nr:ABC-2 transporter permease [Alkalibacillus filiformis]MDQ0352244.1 ABC-2 type transport system permease protein [Alkalibacillus filiformis]
MTNHWFGRVWPIALWQMKQDRVRIPVWIISFLIMTVTTATLFESLYPSAEDRMQLAHSVVNPAITALLGPAYGVDNYDVGAILAHQMLLLTAVVVAVMSILIVTRHTREDEEDGRAELISSLPVGRLSNVTSTLLVQLIVYITLSLFIGLVLVSINIPSITVEGSFLYGAALGVTGFLFAAVTAVMAQLSETARGTMGLSFAVMLTFYLIRAIGDVSYDPLSWFSPLGWMLESRVFVENNWWMILLMFAVAFLIAMIAMYLNAIRDVGAGLLPSKPGKPHASKWLKSPLGFTIRMQRTSIIAWTIGMFVFGATYGSVLVETDTYVAEIEIMAQMLGEDLGTGFELIEQFIVMLGAIISIVATIPMILSMYRLSKEEKNNRIEQVVATTLSRRKLIGSYLLTALIISVLIMASAAFGMALAGALTLDELAFSTAFNAIIVYLPATWVMIGLAALCVGLGKWKGLTWLYLGYAFIVIYLGGILEFPSWMKSLSPYELVPGLPVEEMNWSALFGLIMMTILLIVISLQLYANRDLKG